MRINWQRQQDNYWILNDFLISAIVIFGLSEHIIKMFTFIRGHWADPVRAVLIPADPP